MSLKRGREPLQLFNLDFKQGCNAPGDFYVGYIAGISGSLDPARPAGQVWAKIYMFDVDNTSTPTLLTAQVHHSARTKFFDVLLPHRFVKIGNFSLEDANPKFDQATDLDTIMTITKNTWCERLDGDIFKVDPYVTVATPIRTLLASEKWTVADLVFGVVHIGDMKLSAKEGVGVCEAIIVDGPGASDTATVALKEQHRGIIDHMLAKQRAGEHAIVGAKNVVRSEYQGVAGLTSQPSTVYMTNVRDERAKLRIEEGLELACGKALGAGHRMITGTFTVVFPGAPPLRTERSATGERHSCAFLRGIISRSDGPSVPAAAESNTVISALIGLDSGDALLHLYEKKPAVCKEMLAGLAAVGDFKVKGGTVTSFTPVLAVEGVEMNTDAA